MTNKQKWVVALTGASGMRYGLRLLEIASQHMSEVHVVFSEAGLRVLREEEGKAISFANMSCQSLFGAERNNVYFYNPRDIGAAIASGSVVLDGMVVVPCTTGTMAAIANGICDNLIHRAADVALKEHRKLILVPRETPLSSIQIENMLKLSKAGAAIVPAMPGFYHMPNSLSELVDMMVMKILDQMGCQINLVQRWKDLDAQHEAQSHIQSHIKVIGQNKFFTE